MLGEGEETLLELARLDAVEADYSGIAGIAYRLRDGTVRRNPERPPPDIESLPFPYQGSATDLLARHLRHRTVRESVGYEVARGCPHQCTFCYSPAFHGRLRVKSSNRVAAELDALRRLGVTDIDIYDDTLFGGDPSRRDGYVEALRAAGLTWMANFRADDVNEASLRALADAGCRWLYFGLEAADDARRAKVKHGLRTDRIEHAVRCLGASGIGAVYSIIFAPPTESEPDDPDRCLDFVDHLHSMHPSAEIQVQSFVPLPETLLYEAAIRRGFVPPETLSQWARHDHLRVRNPWQPDPALGRKLYLCSFLAFRYRRHLSRLPLSLGGYPLHRLAVWRMHRRVFAWCLEPLIFEAFDAVAQGVDAVRFKLALLRPLKRVRPDSW